MSLARTYRGIPRDWGAIPPSPVGPEMSQYKPPAFGRRFVLPFQGLRVLGGIAPQSLGIPRYVLARLMVFYHCYYLGKFAAYTTYKVAFMDK